MKFALLAAAALLATPVLAQTTTAPINDPAAAPAQNPSPTTTTPATPANDPAMTAQQPMQDMSTPDAADSTATQSSTMNQTPATPATGATAPATGATPAGGYQPSQPMPMAQNGVAPVFTPGPSVEQAYPAPAPLASYPVCKKGQYDKCMQRGGR